MEEVFDFREFVIKILRRFRLIFVLALLFAAIAASYKLYRAWPELTGVQPVQTDSDRESRALVEERKAYLNDQILYSEQRMQYFQNSLNILKKVDPERLYSLRRIVLVDAEIGMEYAGRIADLYVALAQNIEFYEWIADKLETDMPVDFLQELVMVQSGTGQDQSSEYGFLSVYVTGESPEFCIAATDAAWEYINKEIDARNILDESYTLRLVNPEAKPVLDGSFFERKLEALQQIKVSASELAALDKELKSLDEAPVIITKSSVIKSVIMYTALGLMIGLGVGLIWIFFCDVMDLRIRDSKEVGKKFGLKCLSEFYDEEKRRPFSRIDKWIDRLDGIGFEKPTEEQSTDILAASIEEMSGGIVQKILLTGDLPPERLERLKTGLAEKMEEVDVFCAGDITLPEDTLKLAKECGEIILVIRKNESTYPNVEKQLKCFDNIGKKVLGFVMAQ